MNPVEIKIRKEFSSFPVRSWSIWKEWTQTSSLTFCTTGLGDNLFLQTAHTPIWVRSAKLNQNHWSGTDFSDCFLFTDNRQNDWSASVWVRRIDRVGLHRTQNRAASRTGAAARNQGSLEQQQPATGERRHGVSQLGPQEKVQLRLQNERYWERDSAAEESEEQVCLRHALWGGQVQHEHLHRDLSVRHKPGMTTRVQHSALKILQWLYLCGQRKEAREFDVFEPVNCERGRATGWFRDFGILWKPCRCQNL